jgi:hypothetical protein
MSARFKSGRRREAEADGRAEGTQSARHWAADGVAGADWSLGGVEWA